MGEPEFFVSSTASEDGPVEVAEEDDMFIVRNGSLGEIVELRFTRKEWDAFLEGVKDGEFDDL